MLAMRLADFFVAEIGAEIVDQHLRRGALRAPFSAEQPVISWQMSCSSTRAHAVRPYGRWLNGGGNV